MVIPLYNKINAIRTTLDSVVAYHGKAEFECIIVDDNSTDGSSEIAMEYECNYPDLFTYIKIQHRGKYGPTNARNFGVRLCDSEYICFLDADDELYDGHLDRCFDFLNNNKRFDCYGENFALNKEEEELSNIEHTYNPTDIHYFIRNLSTNLIHFCSFLYRTKIVKDIPFRDCPSEDLVFLLTIMNRYKFYINLSKFGLIYHREHSNVNIEYEKTYDLKECGVDYCRWEQIIKDNPDFPYYIKITHSQPYEQWELKRINNDK